MKRDWFKATVSARSRGTEWRIFKARGKNKATSSLGITVSFIRYTVY